MTNENDMVRRSMGRIPLLAGARQKNHKTDKCTPKGYWAGHFDGIGKPEPLKGSYSGFWIRRIDDSNRLIYHVNNGTLEILSCKGRYED